MKLPEKIKVLSQDYEIKIMSPDISKELKVLGSCDNALATITIDDQCDSQQQAATLIHEILHAVSFLMAVEVKDFKDEEDMVSPMSNGLAAVMRDNPKTFKAIMEALG